jgi:hypothetical protein
MEAICSSETSVGLYSNIRHCIPEDTTVYLYESASYVYLSSFTTFKYSLPCCDITLPLFIYLTTLPIAQIIWGQMVGWLSIYLWLYGPCGTLPPFRFSNLYTVGRTPRTGDQPVARPLLIHRTTQRQNKPTQTFIPRMGFEPTIPAFELAKTVHALDRAATVIGGRIIRE